MAIEVTIASVTLTDELDFGVEWLFKGGAPSGRGAGGLIIRSTPFNPGGSQNPNNTGARHRARASRYIIQNANFPGGIQAILHLLDTYGDTKVVANPHLAALDNQKATIKAGNKIPINQQSFVGSGANVNTNVVTTTSQYIDTGVLLQVTPHINAGGLITLDVQAEVSDPGPVANSGDAPPINTRSVQTIVSVQSGQTMVMGGLIGETTRQHVEGPAAPVPHSDPRRALRRAVAHQEPHRARDVHHAARGRERERPQEHDRGSAPPDAADRRHVRRLPQGEVAGCLQRRTGRAASAFRAGRACARAPAPKP